MNKTIEVIKDIRTLCTHVFEGGHRCASPALQREAFCYYHHPNRKPLPNPSRRRSRRQSFDLSLPAGQSDLQHAVYEVIRRLAANQISTRHAGLILNALHNATRNSPPAPPTSTASSQPDANVACAPSSSPAHAHTPAALRAPALLHCRTAADRPPASLTEPLPSSIHPQASTTAAAATVASAPDSPHPLQSATTSNSHPQKKTQSADAPPAAAPTAPARLHAEPASAHSQRYRTQDPHPQPRCTSKLPFTAVYPAKRHSESITEATKEAPVVPTEAIRPTPHRESPMKFLTECKALQKQSTASIA